MRKLDFLRAILFHGAARRWVAPAVITASLFSLPPLMHVAGAKDKDKEKEKSSERKEKERGKEKDKDKETSKKETSKESSKPPEKVAAKVDDKTRTPASIPDKSTLSPFLEAARSSLESVKKLKSYSATFSKNERLKKGMLQQTMFLKVRSEPFSVYLKFVDPHEGREVIYVEGQNKGKMLAHEGSGIASLAGTVSLTPTGSDAMKENRYPITMIGMEKLLDSMITQTELELKHGVPELKTYPNAKVADADCTMYELIHPEQRPQCKFHKVRLYIDKKTNLPIRSEQYGFPAKSGEEGPLLEEYTYTNIRSDTQLTDSDFDPKNKAYSF